MIQKNVIVEKSFAFALQIIEFSEMLEEHKKYIIARQVLKAGTSIGANIYEAQSAESKADFIHKMKIADKEANELEYWLKLCESAKNYPYQLELQENLVVLKKLLAKIISTSKSTQ
jgi:four helix bundle protein